MMIEKVISGGQTGAERGALDAAIAHGFPYGGWTVYGRRAEDGSVPKKYQLQEHALMSYRHKVRACVRDADAVVVFTLGDCVQPDDDDRLMEFLSDPLVCQVAKLFKRPLCRIDLHELEEDGAAVMLTSWIQDCEDLGREIKVLYVTGPRESVSPGLQKQVQQVMTLVLDARSVPESPEITSDPSLGEGTACGSGDPELQIPAHE